MQELLSCRKGLCVTNLRDFGIFLEYLVCKLGAEFDDDDVTLIRAVNDHFLV